MKSPFKFLDSYTKDDREIFFGREREIEELYHRVFESKTMLVYGVSGTGKSSLIHCGLANKFQETDWLPLEIRRGGNILESLVAAIRSVSITPQLQEIVTASQFKKAVRSLYLDHYKPVYFIFDQFEELFIFGNKDEKKAIVQIIKSLVESEIQCRFIFVMREEYMGGITKFEKYIPTIFANRVRVEKMAHINAIEAIKGPCKVANIDLEDGFAEALLEKLSPESADVELTYLQVFLDKIYRSVKEEKQNDSIRLSFTVSRLQKAGNVSDLLGSFLEEQLKELNEPDTGLTILKSFVSIKGTKKQLNLEEVIEVSRSFGKDIPGNIVSDLLQKFVKIRILRDKDGNGRYELRHDSLAAKIYEKITIVEKEMLEIYQFLENAIIAYRKRNLLLSSDDLKYIAPYEDRLFVNKEIGNLIEISKKESNKIRKRIKKIAYSGFCSILIFTIGTIFKTNHLPFANELRILGLIVYIIWFLPLFGFYVFKVRENRTINFLFLIFTLLFVANTFSLIRIMNDKLNFALRFPVLENAEKIGKEYKEIIEYNKGIIENINKISKEYSNLNVENKDLTNKLEERTNELVTYVQELKIYIIKAVMGNDSSALEGKEIKVSRLKKLDDPNVSSQILIGSNSDGKAFELRILLNNYKKFLCSIVNNDSVMTRRFEIVLNTLNNRSIHPGIYYEENESWESRTFQSLPYCFVINILGQIQCDVKTCEKEVLVFIQNKMNSQLIKQNNLYKIK